MSKKPRVALRAFLLFAAVLIALAVALGAVGFGIAQERFGESHAQAWLVGCGVSLVASLVSGIAVWMMAASGASGVTVALGSMLLRLVLLGLLGAGVVTAFGIAVRPFLLAVAASYLALLVADTGFSLAVARGPEASRA